MKSSLLPFRWPMSVDALDRSDFNSRSSKSSARLAARDAEVLRRLFGAADPVVDLVVGGTAVFAGSFLVLVSKKASRTPTSLSLSVNDFSSPSIDKDTT